MVLDIYDLLIKKKIKTQKPIQLILESYKTQNQYRKQILLIFLPSKWTSNQAKFNIFLFINKFNNF